MCMRVRVRVCVCVSVCVGMCMCVCDGVDYSSVRLSIDFTLSSMTIKFDMISNSISALFHRLCLSRVVERFSAINKCGYINMITLNDRLMLCNVYHTGYASIRMSIWSDKTSAANGFPERSSNAALVATLTSYLHCFSFMDSILRLVND